MSKLGKQVTKDVEAMKKDREQRRVKFIKDYAPIFLHASISVEAQREGDVADAISVAAEMFDALEKL